MNQNVAEILKETTNWDVPNHTYLLNEAGKALGYVPEGTDEIQWFGAPRAFSKRYRKFKKLHECKAKN